MTRLTLNRPDFGLVSDVGADLVPRSHAEVMEWSCILMVNSVYMCLSVCFETSPYGVWFTSCGQQREDRGGRFWRCLSVYVSSGVIVCVKRKSVDKLGSERMRADRLLVVLSVVVDVVVVADDASWWLYWWDVGLVFFWQAGKMAGKRLQNLHKQSRLVWRLNILTTHYINAKLQNSGLLSALLLLWYWFLLESSVLVVSKLPGLNHVCVCACFCKCVSLARSG